MKVCSLCKIEKSISSFQNNPMGKYGVRSFCRDCQLERNKLYKKRTSEEMQAYRKHYLSDPEKREKSLEATRRWRESNKEYDAFRARTYRAKKLQRLPHWADLSKIKQIYLDCPIGLHVDHIVPLQGKVVSGLHVENNLQYLTPRENMAKRNIYHV